jgi:hypothetical protein
MIMEKILEINQSPFFASKFLFNSLPLIQTSNPTRPRDRRRKPHRSPITGRLLIYGHDSDLHNNYPETTLHSGKQANEKRNRPRPICRHVKNRGQSGARHL